MTSEEIKQQYTMRDIVERYGFQPNRAGFIKCPFHPGDHTASMKIYKHDAHCFGCGWNGDIFAFVQQIDNLTFKEAFYQLGGEYDKPSYKSKMAVYHAKQAVATRKKQERTEHRKRQDNIHDIDFYRAEIERREPMSDRWCFAMNELQKSLYLHGELNGIPY
ncbi:MAG: CHC2 zinc finger domain-containing protein [Anaerobutyricum hallii]|uniref:CHC2 zinc finger domain-containing protein n=1 Tax=Anaerobutyricum hallii TaxID=39488 RepID=UPI002A806A11|nr:CHC2 zinc finger domain-containing protein [Anaerobutyricum hallii]MDY4579771.1 CHC2 zinc finger domain-containing protein [Anaerobutyricum hallii]